MNSIRQLQVEWKHRQEMRSETRGQVCIKIKPKKTKIWTKRADVTSLFRWLTVYCMIWLSHFRWSLVREGKCIICQCCWLAGVTWQFVQSKVFKRCTWPHKQIPTLAGKYLSLHSSVMLLTHTDACNQMQHVRLIHAASWAAECQFGFHWQEEISKKSQRLY